MNRQAKIDQTGNGFCGPLSLAAIFGRGCTTAEAAERVRKACGYLDGRAIKGMSNGEMRRTLEAHGYVMLMHEVQKKSVAVNCINDRRNQVLMGPTFAAWLRGRKAQHRNACFLVSFNTHYVLVQGRKMIDTHSGGRWIFTGESNQRRRRVAKVWEVYKPPSIAAQERAFTRHDGALHGGSTA